MHLNTTQTQDVEGWKPARKEKKEKTKIDLCCLEQARKILGLHRKNKYSPFEVVDFEILYSLKQRLSTVLSEGLYCTAVSHYDCTLFFDFSEGRSSRDSPLASSVWIPKIGKSEPWNSCWYMRSYNMLQIQISLYHSMRIHQCEPRFPTDWQAVPHLRGRDEEW